MGKKENYFSFIRAIQHFECALNGEENEEFDDAFTQRNTSYVGMSRSNTSFESMMSESEYSVLSGIDRGIKLRYMKSQKIIKIDGKSDEENGCRQIDAIIIGKLCKEMRDANVYRNEFPQYVNSMFRVQVCRREHIFINLSDLKMNFEPFCEILLSNDCDSLVQFDVLCKLFLNVTNIVVDMSGDEQLTTNYLLCFCNQMLEIEQWLDSNIECKLERVVLLKVKKESLKLDVWDEVHRKYNDEFAQHLWFKCISMFRYNFEKNLSVFFDEEAYKLHLRSQQETDDQSSGTGNGNGSGNGNGNGYNERLITEDDVSLDPTKSYAL